MAKLGYTWYPKDWGNSEAVFELDLTQRGLYREIIDLAMLNDNKTVINKKVWCRKWNIQQKDLEELLKGLVELKLITMQGSQVFVPSCEPRLNLVRGGKKGGTKSKPNPKPIDKPNPKPDSNQSKLKEKESKVNHEFESEDYKKQLSDKFMEFISRHKLDKEKVIYTSLKAYEYYKELGWYNSKGKEIQNLYVTIQNNWFKDKSEFKPNTKQTAGDPNTW